MFLDIVANSHLSLYVIQGETIKREQQLVQAKDRELAQAQQQIQDMEQQIQDMERQIQDMERQMQEVYRRTGIYTA